MTAPLRMHTTCILHAYYMHTPYLPSRSPKRPSGCMPSSSLECRPSAGPARENELE